MPYLNLPTDIAERAQAFTGRTWVLQHVLNWLDHGTEQFFLLTGEPGSGKTALAAWLCGAGPAPRDDAEREGLERVRLAWSAAHFCVGRTQGDSISPNHFASALAQQLSDHYVDYATAAVNALDPAFQIDQRVQQNLGQVIGIKTNTLIVNGRHPDEVYRLAVRLPLKALLASQPALRILILVDALDEALLFDEQQNIVALLAGSTDLGGVRFLLTCRSNERRVIDRFENARLLDISSPTWIGDNNSDVQSYVLQRLAEPSLQARIPAGTRIDDLAAQLVDVAERNFLYIRFLLDEVQSAQRNLDKLTGLPGGLYALYRSYLDRVVPDAGGQQFAETWLNGYEPLLGSLSVAVPVAANQLLARWLGWDKGEVQARLDTVTQVVECTEEHGGGCTLYHRSMADFLAADSYQESNRRRRNQYYAEPRRQHDRIARYYLEAIRNRWQGDWSKCDEYGLRRLVTHLGTRLELAEADDQPLLAADLYRVVLDAGFRSAQQQRFADNSASLPDLRAALETALARDDLVAALRCIAAYRQTVRSQSVTQTIFDAVDRGDFAAALKAADYYGPAPKPRGRWARVLHFYLVWEAAEQGRPDDARQAAAAAATLAPQDWTHALYEDLSDILLLRAGRRLAGTPQELVAQLSELVPGRDIAVLLSRHSKPATLSADLQQTRETQLEQRLLQLERLAAEGSAEFVSGVLFLDPETIAAETAGLQSLLTELAPYPAGQAGIDRALGANLANPYPRYRDIALVPIALATAHVSDASWSRQRLRTILRTGLDSEGITFTFELPAILLEEAGRRAFASPELTSYLEQALQQDDRWGTQVRAHSARAAALFWQGQPADALAALQEASRVPRTYAGYASLALLLLANRCHEFGVPERAGQAVWGTNFDVSLLDGATALVQNVYDPDFRAERGQLVQRYRDWLAQPARDIAALREALGGIQDPDTRRVYKDLAGARWAAAAPPDVHALKALVLTMLADSTTLDATLGRLFGLRLREHRQGSAVLDDSELLEALSVCSEHFTTGRPWEFGKWH